MKLKWSDYVFMWDIDDSKHGEAVMAFNSLNRGAYYISKEHKKGIDTFLETNICSDDEIKDNIARLFYEEVLVPFEQDESIKVDVLRHQYYKESVRSVFYFIPTFNCNFKCPYCIQSNTIHNMKKKAPIMDENFARQCGKWMVDFSVKTKKKELLICFYGGEPLIAHKANIAMMDEVKKNKPDDLFVDYILITNGYLLNEIILKEMKDLGLSTVQITLDGPPEIHDKRRVNVDNTKTFDVIIRNIQLARRMGLRIAIRINIDEKNAHSIDKLLDILRSEGINEYAEIKFAPVDSWSSACSSNGHIPKTLRWFDDIYRNAKNKGFLASMWESLCGIYGLAFFAITPDGNLYKCPSFAGVKGQEVGNIQKDELYPKYYEYTERDLSERCKKCKWVGVCGGGCLYQRFLISEDFDDSYCVKDTFETIVKAYYSNVYNSDVIERLVRSGEAI